MVETLYRKYRPGTFADVTEQGHVVRTVQNQLAAGTTAHAYLFAGPRGVGKTTIARLLAKAVNCEGRKAGESEPCNTCGPCTEFAAGRFMDTVEIDAASHTGVDNVRENIIENVRFFPQRGKFKVFIIDEVHMLSTSAFNALLKTLEEPPAHAMFILATTELHKIPATIISRCQRFDFHRIPAAEMITRLGKLAVGEGVEVEEGVLAQIARLSEGCLRDAESLLGQVLAIGGKKITVEDASVVLPATNAVLVGELVAALGADDLKTALDKLNAFVRDGGSVKQLGEELLEAVRDEMFQAIAGASAKFGAADGRRLLDLLLSARNRPSLSLLPQLPLELAFVEFVTGRGAVAAAAAAPRPAAPAGGSLVAPRPTAPVKAEASAAPAPNTRIDAAKPVSFTLQELQDKWERCCDYVGDRNVALPLVLRAGKPYAVEGNTVTISYAYDFHADAMKEGKNLRLLEEAIAAVMMEPVMVKAHVAPAASESSVDSLAAAFGGSVVG